MLIRSVVALPTLLLLIPAWSGSLFSQDTISYAEFQAVMANSERIQYTLEYSPNPAVDLGATSPAAGTFDFSAVPNESSRDSVLLNFTDPAGQPGEGQFPGASLCTPRVITPTDSSEITFVGYYLLRPDGFYHMGNFIRQRVSTLLDTAVVQRYRPEKLLIPLPLSYGVTRTGVDTLMVDGSGDEYSVTVTTIECDGWGEVTVPAVSGPGPFAAGGAVGCLRFTTTETEEMFFDGSFDGREKRVHVGYLTPDGALLTVNQNDSDYTDGIAAVTGIVYSTPVGATAVRMVSGELPRGLVLFQNYPNPFNPATTIAFTLPVTGRVKIEIFDLLGRVVSSPVDADLATGSYTVPFDAARLPSGIYACRLTAAGGVVVKKMSILR